LNTKENMSPGYKPLHYEEIPKDFDQQTHYIVEKDPVDKQDHIFIAIDIKELEIDDEENFEYWEEGHVGNH